jgi:hypothetical protein
MGLAASTTNVEEHVDGGLHGGHCLQVRQRPPLRLKKMSTASPLGVLPAGPTASTTDDQEDIDGGPPKGCYRWVQQQPPPMLKKTSMAGLLGDATGGTGSIHHRC